MFGGRVPDDRIHASALTEELRSAGGRPPPGCGILKGGGSKGERYLGQFGGALGNTSKYWES